MDGHIGDPATAYRIVETALSRFKSIDALVNNAGIFFAKPFTDYTAEDFKSLVSTNVEGFLYVTQLSIKHVLVQKTGDLETITQHLAMEYAKDGIRVNAVAPSVVYTPLHREAPQDVMESLSPMGRPSTVKDITDAVMYLADAATVEHGGVMESRFNPTFPARIHKFADDVALAVFIGAVLDAIAGGVGGPQANTALMPGGQHGIFCPHSFGGAHPLLHIERGGIELRRRLKNIAMFLSGEYIQVVV